MSEEIKRIFDQLTRLSMFKPTGYRKCECKIKFLKPMKYHYLYRCTFCDGKVRPEEKKGE